MLLFWFNTCLTVALLAALVMDALPLAVLFMVAFAVAMQANFPSLEQQRERLAAHSGDSQMNE